VDAGAEHRHRLGAVAVLAALVLHGDDDAGGQVRQPHGRIGLVDVLAAGPTRTINVDAQVLVLDLHVDLGRLGHHRDGGGGSVDAPAALGHRHTLHAMHAAFELELGEHTGADDLGDHFLEAAEVVGVHVHDL